MKIGTMIREFITLLVVVVVAYNTLGYSTLVNYNHPEEVIAKVNANANKVRDLENKLLENQDSIDSLSANPIELMEANVMIYTSTAKGSGSVIRVEKDYSYVLTAAHVISTTKFVRGEDGKLVKGTTIDENIKVLYGKDFKKKVKAVVQKINQERDLAVLKVFTNLKVKPIKIAQKESTLGQTVWSLSNPGRQEGVINKGIFSDLTPEYSYVSLSGYFGSSGGMCLNNKGEQIGVIHTVIITRIGGYFPSLTSYNGITRTKILHKFLKGLL